MAPGRPEAAAAIQGARRTQPQYLINPMSLSLLQAFSDEASREILNSTISECKSIEQVARENDIPVSTAYRRVHHLVEKGLLLVERIVIADGGKRYSLFRSTLRGARIEVQEGGIQVTCAPNQGIANIAFKIWRFNNKDPDPAAII